MNPGLSLANLLRGEGLDCICVRVMIRGKNTGYWKLEGGK